jgi:hypothetical protein
MTSAATDSEPRRLTPTERLHEVTLAALAPSPRAARAPSFKLKDVTAPGKTTVTEVEIDVPVCDEYPTAELAFAAALDFTARARERFPLPPGYNELAAPPQGEGDKVARKAAAIARNAS